MFEFYRFRIHSADFLIFRRISVTRQFLISLTSIVGKKKVTDILLNIRKSSGFENGQTQLFNSGGVVK